MRAAHPSRSRSCMICRSPSVCGAHLDGQDGLHRVRWVWGGSESAGAMPSSRGRSSLSSSSSSGRKDANIVCPILTSEDDPAVRAGRRCRGRGGRGRAAFAQLPRPGERKLRDARHAWPRVPHRVPPGCEPPRTLVSAQTIEQIFDARSCPWPTAVKTVLDCISKYL